MELNSALVNRAELLALLLDKTFWNKHRSKVLKSMFPQPFDRLYTTIAKYHEDHSDSLSKDMLWELIKIDNPTMTEPQKRELYEAVSNVRELEVGWTEEFAVKLLRYAWKQEVWRQVTELGIKGSQGVVDTLEPLADIVEQHSADFIPTNRILECSDGVEELLISDKNTKLWYVGPDNLKEKLGGMQGGQFLQLMARPDVGKTAYIVSIVCGPGGFADQGATVDWYGNEEPIKRTRWRCISSFTGLTKEELIKEPERAKQIFEKINGRVKTFDVPYGLPVEYIAQRTRDRKPDILIVDQLDKLGVSSLSGGGFASETERLRILYIKFREIAKRTGCLVIGVCQASADAEGKTIVTYDQAENSKTGKAAECDVFLGIGKAPMTGAEEGYMRWLTVSKSKLDSGWKGTIVAKLIPQLSRYEE